MTTLEPVLAHRATGLLQAFNEAGVLHCADVHVATRLGRLGGETDERVLLAAALAVRGVRQGAVALALAEVPRTVTPDDPEGSGAVPAAPLPWPDVDAWVAAVEGSAIVALDGTPGRPLRWENGMLWLDRYWRQEVAVAADLRDRAAHPPPVELPSLRSGLARLWPGAEPDDQREAAAACALSSVAVLGGGPGTGKTTTVAKVLALLAQLARGTPLRIALAAPTGKAAARLRDAVRGVAEEEGSPLSPEDRELLRSLEASTLHRLLGVRRGSARFWHGKDNRLPHDVVVVDEASMLSLTMVARLLEALRPNARLLLVGDPDQLASVEAGAVLADLVAPALDRPRSARVAAALAEVLSGVTSYDAASETAAPAVQDGVALLRTVRRYDAKGPIAELAEAVRGGDGDEVLAVLRRGEARLRFVELADDAAVTGQALAVLREEVLATARAVVAAARSRGEPGLRAALEALDGHRLLCAHRSGPRGVAHWNSVVQRWVLEEVGVEARADGRYVGQPLLVTANDYDNGLYNGDTGVVVDRGDALAAVFGRGDGPFEVPLGRLSEVRVMHAMTVHRSQGSQFRRVTVLLPPASSPLGTRGTFYTAVTRAKESACVIGSADAVLAAVARPVARASGLRWRLSA